MGTLANTLPIIPHESIPGVDCCGCIVPEDLGPDKVRLRCNECGQEVGTISTGILRDLVSLIPTGKLRWKL